MILTPNIQKLSAHFQVRGAFVTAQPYGSGHINDTYCATYLDGKAQARYIHQRINHNIFHNPPAVMENIERVTNHIRSKLVGLRDVDRRVLTIIPTHDGQAFTQDDAGNYWRTFLFIENAHTHDMAESPSQAMETGRAFGEFQRLLADLPPPELHRTIPGFHDTAKRFAALQHAIEADTCNRARSAAAEIAWALKRQPWTIALHHVADLPERITHNDTKFNNLMIDDATGESICVVDLDTVMQGLALYDFGDMVRTVTNSAREDEKDLSKVKMQFPMFEALVRGYLSSAVSFLTQTEKDYLPFAGKLITFETGIRFLTDYLDGDVYFKVHRVDHNLDRCRTQFKLAESIEQHEDKMSKAITSFAPSSESY